MVGQDKRVTSRVVEVGTAAEKIVKHVHFGVLRDSPTDELHVQCRTAWRRRYATRVVAMLMTDHSFAPRTLDATAVELRHATAWRAPQALPRSAPATRTPSAGHSPNAAAGRQVCTVRGGQPQP